MEILVGVVLGTLVVVVVGLVFRRSLFPGPTPQSGKLLSLSEVTELVRVINEENVRGIRSIMGLDLPGEIVKAVDDEEESPISVVRQLEMDPFMMTEEEWLNNQQNSNGE